MPNEPMIQMTDCDGVQLRLDNATLASNGPNTEINKMKRCRATDVSMRGTKVVSGSGDCGRHGDGSLTLNNISNCEDITIDQTGMSIKGRHSDVELNKVADTKNAKIHQRRLVLDADYIDPDTASSTETDRERRQLAGRCRANHIVASENVLIDQDDMFISGQFSEVELNAIDSSRGTTISQKNMVLDNNYSSSEEDSDSDYDGDERPVTECATVHPSADNCHHAQSSIIDQVGGAKAFDVSAESASAKTIDSEKSTELSRQKQMSPSQNPDHFDTDGLPKPNTYEYRIAKKVSFNVKLIGGGSVTCTRLQQDLIRNLISFIVKIHPRSGSDHFRLLDEETNDFVDGNKEATLAEAGFKNNMELRTVYDTL